MRKLFTLFVFIFVCVGYSQTNVQDSLAIQLAFQKTDTSKIKTSLRLVEALYQTKDYDKALKYASQSEKLSANLNYEKGIAKIAYYKALIYTKKDDYINAMDSYSKSKSLFLLLKDTLHVARVNNNIGLLEIERGNYEKGLKYSLSAIKELEKRHLTKELCLAYQSLAIAYSNMQITDKAIDYYLKALELQVLQQDKPAVIETNRALALLYSQEKEHRKAIQYYEKTLDLIDEENDSIRGEILPKLGGEHLQFKDYELASEYLIESLKLNRKLGNKSGLLISLNNIGNLNIQQRRLKYAENQLLEANAIAKSLDNNEELLKNFKLLKSLDSTNKNFDRAFIWQREYYSLKTKLEKAKIQKPTVKESTDTLIEDTSLNINNSNTSYLVAEQKKENSENEKKLNDLKLIFYALLAAFAVVLTFFVLIYLKRNNSIKYTHELEEKNKKIELQNKAILEQTKHLEDINKVKDRLFSIVSHDLKDSLTSIKGFIDLLKEGSLSQTEFDNLIPELSENANNASLLLFNLLNWSKSQMQALEPSPSLFDIQEVFEDKVHLLEQKIENKGIIIRDHTLKDFIYADRSMIEIIIQNLLTNAVKFSRSGDTITISNHISNGNSVISISDTGVGISPENKEKIFKNNSFTTNGTKNEKGTGLGLTICKELVELNKGKIWVESTLNVGSTFYIELPKSNTEN
ncbi:ATP-binding protein [Corallibacter sp.]|uniref:tetratricopeptide repeat-containing sensor histidine kinase n=1 Tax=Corallibacter sp. TaxID=2038084 RepID=UPI003AB56335